MRSAAAPLFALSWPAMLIEMITAKSKPNFDFFISLHLVWCRAADSPALPQCDARSFLTTWPSFITKRTRSNSVTSASGSPETATVIDNRGEAAVLTDGPFVESKEYLAGFWIIEAPDLDVALKLATEGSKACNRKVEVRPFLIN